MSRKRRHGPPARNRQPRMYEAPRHMSPNMPSGAVGMREHPAGNGNGGSGGATAVVLRDEQGAPYVVLADGGSAASAYAQGGRQTQQAAAQSAQMQRLRNPLTGMTAGAAKPYPDMPQISDAKPFLKSLGATGTAIFSGIITSEEYNADFYWKDAIQIYEQMSRNDAQIYAIKQLLELPIRRATWTVEPGGDTPRDKEIASFVETCLFHDMRYETSEGRVLTQKWDDVLRHILMMLWFGFMAFEVNWRIEDGWTKWARWTPLLPRTIWRWWVGEDNELVGVQQWTYKDYTYVFVDIPADKLLLFTHRQEGNNYEGVSALRSAYKHWYYKDTFYKIQAIDIERNGVSMPVMHLPENFTQDDLNQAQTILANMRANESMGVTLPPGWQLDFGNTHGSSRGGPGTQIDSAIEHHDNMIARNVLGQFINLGSHEVGSYALADTQRAMLLAALQAECEYIEDVINNDAITRLVDYNFDGVESYPRLKASKLIAQDLDVISTALSKLNSSPSGPMIHADAELEDYLRDLYGLPKAPSGVVAGTNPTAPSTPERPETDAAQETAGSDHADAESKDAQPAVRQQATSQAIANGAPGVSGRAAAGSTSVQSSEAALTEEARLLREALAAAYDHDAVERGLVFYNPAHVPAGSPQGGEFAPKGGGDAGGGGGGGGSGHSRSGGAKRGSGAPKASGGGTHSHGGSSRGSGSGDGTKAPKVKAPKARKEPATAKAAEERKAEGKGKAASAGKGEAERIQHIPMAQVHVGLNPREHFDQEHLDELAASIKAHGLLQPITVREHEGGYQIIAGERRFRAMQALGYSHAPAIVKNVDERTARELALIENVARADMRPSETARAYRALMDGGHTVRDISERIGKSQASIQQHLALLELSPHLQRAADEERLPMGAVRELSRLSPAHQDEAADQIIREGMGLRAAKSLLQAYNAKEAQIEMFPTAHGPSKEAIAAHVRYRQSVERITKELAHLDDKTMRQVAGVVDAPFREATRLDLMAKQLRRMQKVLEVAGHARNIGGSAVSASEASTRALTPGQRLYVAVRRALALARRCRVLMRENGDSDTIRLFNPYHIPAGSPQGGEFAPKGGGEGGMGGGGMGGGVHAARGGSGHARGRTASGGGRGRSSGAAHRGGSGGTGRSSGGGSSKASKTKDEGEAKTKARATKPKPTEEEKYQAKRAKLQAEIEGHRQEAERASQERIAAVNRSDLEAAGEATMRSAYHAVTQGEAERKLAALDRAHARTVAKSAAAEGKSEGARSRGSSKAAKSEEAAGRSTTGAKSAREAELEAQLAAVRAENAALRSENEALKGGGARAAKTGEESGAKAKSAGWSEKNAEALRGPTPEPRNVHWSTYSPSAKFDPYRRVEQYGKDQLRAVLVRATQTRLREAARIVMERNPGTKPKSLSSNDSIVNYIMEQVAPDY